MMMNCILCSSGYNTFVLVFLTLHTISPIVVAVTELTSAKRSCSLQCQGFTTMEYVRNMQSHTCRLQRFFNVEYYVMRGVRCSLRDVTAQNCCGLTIVDASVIESNMKFCDRFWRTKILNFVKVGFT